MQAAIDIRMPHVSDNLIVANRGPRRLPLTGWANVGGVTSMVATATHLGPTIPLPETR
jgi:hypothetical protein